MNNSAISFNSLSSVFGNSAIFETMYVSIFRASLAELALSV